jgi:5-(carboxyamino)imidazole ribonucleotide synthase
VDFLAPGSWLGVLGGGQLGRMFAMAAHELGYRVCVLDPEDQGPAAMVCERQIVAPYADEAALDALADLCQAVTTEFENVPAASLARLARRLPVHPSADAVRVAQDRMLEKDFLQRCGIAVAPWTAVASEADAAKADAALFPGILKTARLGYDGKGQRGVADRAELAAAWRLLGGVACILERRMALARELSVVVARAADGEVATFEVQENVHRDGILALSIAPARCAPATAGAAREAALRVVRELSYVGVLCLELFELADGSLLANEMAPRPHNSGHATIDACASSQFDQQARILARLPLGETRMHSPAVLVNLLGDLWQRPGDAPAVPAFDAALRVPGAKLHLYGKTHARRGRKMGHLTVTGPDLATAIARAREAARPLGLESLFDR